MSLEGKTAIVTGASSGIGAATTRALREAGARVVGGARRVNEIDADLALELDVTDPSQAREVRRLVGVLPEESGLYGDLSAARTLDFFGRLYRALEQTRHLLVGQLFRGKPRRVERTAHLFICRERNCIVA